MSSGTSPRISVLLPVYNAEKYLAETIRTITTQSFQDWELIIQDGASADATANIAREYARKDSRIRVASEKDEGPYDAIHRALRAARGEFIFVVCASDGYLDDHWFEKCLRLLDADPELSLVWGIPLEIDASGKALGPHFVYANFLPAKEFKQRENAWNVLTELFRRIDLKNPARFLKKINRTNAASVRRMFTAVPPPQKQAWFQHWLATGIQFPDGNMCVSRRVFAECLPPYTPGTREPGDWTGFYYNFNSKGYLAACVPVLANFGRHHPGQVTEGARDYNDEKRRELFRKIKELRVRYQSQPETFSFRDRAGHSLPHA